ncbi:MAG TPA: hypothetical protein VMD27_11695 [Candidatus Aquilonibacter sp.]|nr:hypothetical protein [Candidatus Aquilonibacter sp.]
MKRWAVLTVAIYALALLLLTIPAILASFRWGAAGGPGVKDAAEIYLQWTYWLWLAVLVAGQVLLLLVPIDISERRLPSRRKLKIPVVVTAFFLGSLCFAGVLSVLCAIFKDDGLDVLAYVDKIFAQNGQITSPGVLCSLFLDTSVFWIIWAFIFHRFAKSDEPDAFIKRAVRWLLRGSILELIVAVPSHVIARRRDDCCAPVGTFWGIATGISVMLLCFGPGVYFLFAERM